MVMHKVVEESPAPLTHVPRALARVIATALSKAPDERYQSVDALKADLLLVEPAATVAPEVTPTPERTIGRYEILERVGQGGMGVVYRARDPMLDRDVAIKCIPADFTADERTAVQFGREARAAARLQHPNIITIYELGEAEGSPFIVMEFLGGTDLDGLVHRDPPLSLADRILLMIQLCAGLSFAQGIIHRDIKPSNVRVLESGTVKLLDFGIAKLSRSDATFSDLAGSVEYMSPEQLEGRAVNERSDVFAVGAVMYELFGGGKPFAGDTPEAIAYHILNERPAPLRSVAPDVPQPLEDIVTRALEKDPDRRHASAAELMAALRLVSETMQPNRRRPPAVSDRAASGARARYGWPAPAPWRPAVRLAICGPTTSARRRPRRRRPQAGGVGESSSESPSRRCWRPPSRSEARSCSAPSVAISRPSTPSRCPGRPDPTRSWHCRSIPSPRARGSSSTARTRSSSTVSGWRSSRRRACRFVIGFRPSSP